MISLFTLLLLVWSNAVIVHAYPKFKGIEATVLPKKTSLRQRPKVMSSHDLNRNTTFIEIDYFAHNGCRKHADTQLFALDVCAPISDQFYMKLVREENENPQIQVFNDPKCSQLAGDSNLKLPLKECLNDKIGNVINDISELPKANPKVMFGLYDNEENCIQNDMTNGLLQANIFSTGICTQTADGDYYFDSCSGGSIFGHFYSSNDGTCSGLAEPFKFTPTYCHSNSESISDNDHFGFMGHLSMKCLV